MIGSQPTGTKSTAPAGQALWEKQESLYWKSTFMIWENGKRWVVVENTILELAFRFYEGKLDGTRRYKDVQISFPSRTNSS